PGNGFLRRRQRTAKEHVNEEGESRRRQQAQAPEGGGSGHAQAQGDAAESGEQIFRVMAKGRAEDQHADAQQECQHTGVDQVVAEGSGAHATAFRRTAGRSPNSPRVSTVRSAMLARAACAPVWQRMAKARTPAGTEEAA